MVVACEDKRGAERALASINGVHLHSESETIGEYGVRNLDTKHLLVLCGFLSASEDEGLAIRGQTIHDLKDKMEREITPPD